jgi:cell division protein FtsI/penicillin-binding protein 2
MLQRFRRRTAVLAAIGTLVLVALVLRLGDIAVLQGPGLKAYAVSERTRTATVPALRGDIVDAEGHLLAGNIVDDDVSVAPKVLTAADITALASALGTTAATVKARMKLGTPLYAMVATDVPDSVGTRVQNLNLPDVDVTQQGQRTYPNGNLLGAVLGFVGAENQGLAGLEYEYNRVLTGRPGRVTEQVDAGGNVLASMPSTVVPAQNGDTIHLTIDRTLSEFAQEILNAGVKKTKAEKGRILIMDPQTGAILGVAQYPSPNPNDPAAAVSWDDQIVQDLYPPGSVFKPVTAAGALRDGVISERSSWYDPGYKIIDGIMVHGWEYPGSFGRVGLTKAFEVSSDIAFMDIGLELGTARFYQNLRLFGLTQAPPIDLPGAATPDILPENLVHPIDLANEAFGQTNTYSTVDIAMADATVASGGLLLQPHVVSEITAPDGKVVARYGRHVIRRVMPTWAAADILKGMEKVISPPGTGAYAQVPGYQLAGKTGTAQLVYSGKVVNVFMSSFLGFGPIPDPRVLILVQLNNPVGAFYGGQIAAPLFAQLMGETLRYLGIPPTKPVPANGVRSVPAVTGASVRAAETAVSDQGLVPLTLGTGAKVVSESPAAGTDVTKGGTVILVLGRHTASTRSGVPDLVGLTLRKAAILLADRGLRLVPIGSGIAVSQLPRPGSSLPHGGAVRVTFRLPAPPPPPPPPAHKVKS